MVNIGRIETKIITAAKTGFKIAGKIKRKVDYRINRERIKIIGIPKEEINWDV